MIGLDQNHHHIYGLIEDAKDVGIWHKDLKEKSKLQQHVLGPILKLLESKKLIKNVKSIQFKNRKVYMVYEMVPAKEVSGGTFHKDGALDQDLITALREHCMTFVNSQNAAVGLADVHQWVQQSGFSENQLAEGDVHDIMNTLVLDHKVMTETRGGKLVYRRSRPRWRPHFMEVAFEYADMNPYVQALVAHRKDLMAGTVCLADENVDTPASRGYVQSGPQVGSR